MMILILAKKNVELNGKSIILYIAVAIIVSEFLVIVIFVYQKCNMKKQTSFDSNIIDPNTSQPETENHEMHYAVLDLPKPPTRSKKSVKKDEVIYAVVKH
jgi:hypothetical protein